MDTLQQYLRFSKGLLHRVFVLIPLIPSIPDIEKTMRSTAEMEKKKK